MKISEREIEKKAIELIRQRKKLFIGKKRTLQKNVENLGYQNHRISIGEENSDLKEKKAGKD